MIVTTYPAWVRAEIEKERELIGWGDKDKAHIVYVERYSVGDGALYSVLAYYDEPNPTPIVIIVSKDPVTGQAHCSATCYDTRQEVTRMFDAVEAHRNAKQTKEDAA